MHSLYSDLGGPLIGEMEHAGGDTAERNAFHVVLPGQFQTGTVAGGQQLPVALGHPAGDDGADGVKNVFCRKIVSLRQLGLPGGNHADPHRG